MAVEIVLYLCLQLPVLWFKACAIPSDIYPSTYPLLVVQVNRFILFMQPDIAFAISIFVAYFIFIILCYMAEIMLITSNN